MATVTVYRQERVDGGVRTGVDVGDEPVLMEFRAGPGQEDPAILWFIDVRLEGQDISPVPSDVRSFVALSLESIKSAVATAADKLAVGLDASWWPFRHESQTAQGTVVVVCNAMTRETGQNIAQHLRTFAAEFEAALPTIPALSEAA